MAVVFPFEASVNFKHITECHVSEDCILDTHWHEKLESYTIKMNIPAVSTILIYEYEVWCYHCV